MSASTLHGQAVLPALRAAGFPIPEDCRWAEIHMGRDEAMTIRFDIFIKRDQLPMLARVFVELAMEYTDLIGGPGNELPEPPDFPDKPQLPDLKPPELPDLKPPLLPDVKPEPTENPL